MAEAPATSPPNTRDVRLTTAQLDDLRTQVEQNRDEALDSRGDWPSRHSERYRRFLADPSLRPPGPWPDAPRLFISVTRYVLERLHAELWQTLFGLEDNIRLVPFGEEDVETADLAQRFMRWSLRKLVKWSVVSSSLLFDALLDSAGAAKVVAWTPPWRLPDTARRFFPRIARVDPLDLSTMLVPPDAEGFQYPDARYIGQEFYLRKDDLIRMRRQGYPNIPDPDEWMPYDQTPTERERAEIEREGTTPSHFHKDTYLFVESYERAVLDHRSGEEEDVIVSWFPYAQAGDGTTTRPARIVRVRRLIEVYPQDDRPRRPFFPITIWAQPRQWRGMNVPDRLESMQDLINRLHEQMVNYGDVSMLPYVFANVFLTGDLPDLRQVRPGSTVPIEDVNGVQFAPVRSLNRHFMEQIQMAFSNIERDTSVTDANLGRQSDRPNAPRTASATLAYLQESRKTFGGLARHAANQFGDLLTFYNRLWQEILPPAFVAPLRRVADIEEDDTRDLFGRLFGGDVRNRFVAMRVVRQQLSGIFDAELDINPEAPYERQTLISLAQLIMPSTANYAMGQRELLRRVWEAYEQHGFEQIWPEQVASIQTQTQILTQQVQLETLRAQLSQFAQLQQAQGGSQPAGPTTPPANGQGGELPAELLQVLGQPPV